MGWADWKHHVVEAATRALADPRLAKVLADPRLVDTLMKAFQLRGRLQSALDARLRAVAERLNLASQSELGELKLALRTLEQQLRAMEGVRPRSAG